MEAKFIEKSDIPTLQTWFLRRGEELQTEMIPECGFIVGDIAACFIYHDESCSLAFIHGFYSNPFAHPKDIVNAFYLIQEKALQFCKKCQIKSVFLTSNVNSIKRISEKMGFKKAESDLEGFLINL